MAIPKHWIGLAGILPALAVLAVLLMAAAPADARGPTVGKASPHPLTASDQDGKAQSRESLTGKRGLVLLFTRSFDW